MAIAPESMTRWPILVPYPKATLLVLFDGACGVCDGFVVWLAEHDAAKRLVFAALQSPTAMSLRRQWGLEESLTTIIATDGTRIETESDALLWIASTLGFPWSLAGILRALPRSLRNILYGLLARNRYRISGQTSTCSIERSADILDRFIPDEWHR